MLIKVLYKKGIMHGYARSKSDGTIIVSIPASLSGDQCFYDALLHKARLLQQKIAKKNVLYPIKDGKVCIFGDYIDCTRIPVDVNAYLTALLLDYVTALCDVYASSIGMAYRTIVVKKLRSKWGSCSSHQDLVFNRDLVSLPLAVVKYVVVHEVAHLLHKHHQKDFWDLVAVLLPDYQEYEKFLKNTVLCHS